MLSHLQNAYRLPNAFWVVWDLKNRKLLKNTLLLTAISLLMRSIGLVFQVYVSKKIGAAGIGLYYLILSVSMFASTVALSGIRFTTTRLVSEELGAGRCGGVRTAVQRCLVYAAVCGLGASAMLYFGAPFIGSSLIGDPRTILSLRILSLSLPFLSMGAVITGYFIAVMRVGYSAADQLIEQLIRMGAIILCLSMIDVSNVEHACAALVVGGVAGESAGFFVVWFLYRRDVRRFSGKSEGNLQLTCRMFGIAVPLALTAYARTALSSVQNLLVPRGIRKSGASGNAALGQYGMIQGMVFPVITFPSALFVSLSELIVPELTGAQVRGETEKIRRKLNRILMLCVKFSLCVMAVFLCFAGDFGESIYGDLAVGRYIRLLAPLMPLMYLDTVTDGMLRGLGQHMSSMRYNIIDSLISTILVYLLVPKFAVEGYIFILYFSEIFNFTLSFLRLWKVTGVKLSLGGIVLPCMAALGAASFSQVLCLSAFGGLRMAERLILEVVLTVFTYLFLMKALSFSPKRGKREKTGRTQKTCVRGQ